MEVGCFVVKTDHTFEEAVSQVKSAETFIYLGLTC